MQFHASYSTTDAALVGYVIGWLTFDVRRTGDRCIIPEGRTRQPDTGARSVANRTHRVLRKQKLCQMVLAFSADVEQDLV